jgi:hypothetical protein
LQSRGCVILTPKILLVTIRTLLKLLNKKKKWRNMPIQLGPLAFPVILIGEQPIRGLIWNLKFDKINHSDNDLSLMVVLVLPEGIKVHASVCVWRGGGLGECTLFWARLPEPLFRIRINL